MLYYLHSNYAWGSYFIRSNRFIISKLTNNWLYDMFQQFIQNDPLFHCYLFRLAL